MKPARRALQTLQAPLVPLLAPLLAALLLVGACAQGSEAAGVVRVLTHEDFHLPAQAIAEFEKTANLKVVVQRLEDRSAVVNLLTRLGDNPVADVVIGIDTLDLDLVITESLVEPYVPLLPEAIDPALRVPNDWLTPVSYLDACPNYALSSYFQATPTPANRLLDRLPDQSGEQLTAPPSNLSDLVDPQNATEIVLPDASTSRMGMYLLLALERLYPTGDRSISASGGATSGDSTGTDGSTSSTVSSEPWPQLLSAMLRSGVQLAPTWEEAYFEHFLQERSLTWGSSGMPTVYAQYHPNLSHQPLEELEVGIGVAHNDCVRIVNYAGITAGTNNRRAAGQFMDFVISPEFQYDIPDRFGSRPARADILSTPEWREFGVRVDTTLLDPAYVGSNWEVWRLTWSQVVREAAAVQDPIPLVVTVTLPDN